MAGKRSDASFHVILLAGGSGTRFWPLSRAKRPKQLLALAGGSPLLVQTWRRVRKLAPPARIWVVTPKALRRDVGRLLPELRKQNLIVEPTPRDTGPAVGLACATVERQDKDAVVGIFPTDHVVRDAGAYVRSVRAAARAAAGGALVCLGIRPDRPATGFGYLKCASRAGTARAVPVERFVEKPDLARARRFVRSGRYLWNAGMFIWKVERFLEELKRTSPAILRGVRACLAGDSRGWNRATKLSVDYAVMEKAGRVKVVALDAGWDDVGSWDAAAALAGRGRPDGRRQIVLDSPDTVVFGERRLIAVVDAPDLAVVDTPDALLIVSRKSSERVREVVQRLRRYGREDLL